MGLMTVRFQNRTVIKDGHYGFNECTSTVIMAYLEFHPKISPYMYRVFESFEDSVAQE